MSESCEGCSHPAHGEQPCPVPVNLMTYVEMCPCGRQDLATKANAP